MMTLKNLKTLKTLIYLNALTTSQPDGSLQKALELKTQRLRMHAIVTTGTTRKSASVAVTVSRQGWSSGTLTQQCRQT